MGKFLPSGDIAFMEKASVFARTIARERELFEVSESDSAALTKAVREFEAALNLARRGGQRSQVSTRRKNETRAQAQAIIMRLAQAIRANNRLSASTKLMLDLKERPTKLKRQTCPQEPPCLRFVQALHAGGGSAPMHELRFSASSAINRAKPAGAVRLEVFVDLVPPDEPIPTHPGANLGGRPWYLRSFTRSPIRLVPPIANVPMRVVYWARWADSLGNVGPFSETAVGWVEGGTHHQMGPALGQREPMRGIDATPSIGPATRDASYSVVVLAAQYQLMNPQSLNPLLPPPEHPQLEGPGA